MWQNMEVLDGVLCLVWCMWEFFTAHKEFVTVKTNRKYPAVSDILDACPNDIVTEGGGEYYSGGPEGGVSLNVVKVLLG